MIRKLLLRRTNIVRLGLAIIAGLAFLHLHRSNSVFLLTEPVVLDTTVFFEGLHKYAVDAPLIKDKYHNDKVLSHALGGHEMLFTKEYLESILNIPLTTVDKLTKSHRGYVDEHMKMLIDKYHLSTFGTIRTSDPEWESYKNTRGYVLIGGGKYLWLSYLVVQQIRSMGSTLPIEIFIASADEYEQDFCESVLPKYNARCNVMDKSVGDIIGRSFKFGGYQFKMLAILTLAFENVIYLDLDLFPTKNVEYLFELDIYKDNGLVLWPDYWARTTNPKFHDIAGHPVKENKIRYSAYDKEHHKEGEKLLPLLLFTFKNSNFHDFEGSLPDPSSEAGVFMVNRTSHRKTLLLALYYNLLGPDFYYPLLTQGGAGEGDKETFIAAAVVMNEPYYQTPKQFWWVGYHHRDKKEFAAKALGHYDPHYKHDLKDAKVIFMHCSYPKYYLDWFYNNKDLAYEDGEHIRMYEGTYENLGYDLDLKLQNYFVQGACKKLSAKGALWAGSFLKYVAEDAEIDKRCDELYIPHLKWLQETTKFPKTLEGAAS